MNSTCPTRKPLQSMALIQRRPLVGRTQPLSILIGEILAETENVYLLQSGLKVGDTSVKVARMEGEKVEYHLCKGSGLEKVRR